MNNRMVNSSTRLFSSLETYSADNLDGRRSGPNSSSNTKFLFLSTLSGNSSIGVTAAGSDRRWHQHEGLLLGVGSNIPRSVAWSVLRNFLMMSILFSIHHGCVVACLSLATTRLGPDLGAWQSFTLYITYTSSALLSATYVVKRLGPRNALISGMTLNCFYVAAFCLATQKLRVKTIAALAGAALGGVGSGFLWTAQGAFFARSAEAHAKALESPTSVSTARLAGLFASLYLGMELGLHSLSSCLIEISNVSWSTIFNIYGIISVLSTIFMLFVNNVEEEEGEVMEVVLGNYNSHTSSDFYYQLTAATQLLVKDSKMKYLVGLSATFGFASAFINSYVNGEAARIILHDDRAQYLGWLTAWISASAALSSLLFGHLTEQRQHRRGMSKGQVLILGAMCFLFLSLLFVVRPQLSHWGWQGLLVVYTLHGVGRATFEGTLKATFADFFPEEKEGAAFANITLQSGLSGVLGHLLAIAIKCHPESTYYCVQYSNGQWHNVLLFELVIIGTALFAIFGYRHAAHIVSRETNNTNRLGNNDGDDEHSIWSLVMIESEDNNSSSSSHTVEPS